MSRSSAALAAATLLFAAGCLDTSTPTISLDFDLTQNGVGDTWDGGIADVAAAQAVNVTQVTDRRAIPGTTTNVLYQSGTNVAGDLFVFQKKYWTNFFPLTRYKAALQVQFVSAVHSGCTTGVGPSVVIKAGVSGEEPRSDADANGVLRLSLDKGTGTAAGDFAQLGDIRNSESGCPAVGTLSAKSTSIVEQHAELITDAAGGFWMFVGTQSSFAGRHELYIVRVHLNLTQQ